MIEGRDAGLYALASVRVGGGREREQRRASVLNERALALEVESALRVRSDLPFVGRARIGRQVAAAELALIQAEAREHDVVERAQAIEAAHRGGGLLEQRARRRGLRVCCAGRDE